MILEYLQLRGCSLIPLLSFFRKRSILRPSLVSNIEAARQDVACSSETKHSITRANLLDTDRFQCPEDIAACFFHPVKPGDELHERTGCVRLELALEFIGSYASDSSEPIQFLAATFDSARYPDQHF